MLLPVKKNLCIKDFNLDCQYCSSDYPCEKMGGVPDTIYKDKFIALSDYIIDR